MSDNKSPFEVQRVTPQALGGRTQEGTYQLNSASIHPIAIVGRDAAGRNIEETRPPCYSLRLVHPDGSINWVPMRTGAVFSLDPIAQRYETLTMRDAILDGWLPLWVCPYTMEFSYVVGGPLAAPPHGVSACEGDKRALEANLKHEDLTKPADDPSRLILGCSHLKALIMERRRSAQERFRADAQIATNLSVDQVKALMGGVGDAIAEAIHGNPADLKARKSRMASDNVAGR